MKKKHLLTKTKKTLLIILVIFFYNTGYSQQYLKTYVENPLVKQNIFKTISPDTTKPPLFVNVKNKLPYPFWEARQDIINCYWRTWELAFSNIKQVKKENGFVSPYIDPAFNNNIFMWDCSYMTMFGKYAYSIFNIQQTLNNFYSKQHPDGFICREIKGSDGADVFERYDPASTGPNIMPWSEWEYYTNFKDKSRLEKVFPALLAYYEWYSTYRSWPDGTYFSSGWGCGMDNQPRVPKEYSKEFSHAFMSWIDISFQEIFTGKILIEMAKVLNRQQDVYYMNDKIQKLTEQINNTMWDETEKYYFDRFRNGELSKTKSIASYWGLLAGAIPDNRIKSFVKHLEDTGRFARIHRVPTLAADDPNYNPDGGYWNGAIWAPTNYMVLRGLTRYGYDSLAYNIALNHLNNVVEVYSKTGTLWENYAPEKIQGNNRPNFVGWTGLVPVNVLFEYVFGIRPNVANNSLTIDVNLLDEYGIKQYPYGENGNLDILIKKRKKINEKPSLVITTNIPLKLLVKWAGGEYTLNLDSGKHILNN